jgi:hypothetical protein
MPVEKNGLHATEFPALKQPILYSGLELLELGDDLRLGLVDQYAVIGICRRFLRAEEVRVVGLEIAIFQVRELPVALAEFVVALGVGLEEGDGDLVPKPNLAEGIEGQLFGGYQEPILALAEQ